VATPAPTTPARASLAAGNHDQTLTVGGRERTYLLHMPPGTADPAGWPLVIVLHGLSGSPSAVALSTGWSRQADTVGAVVVYPAGIENSWNARFCCGPAQEQGIDDVGFIRTLIAAVGQAVPVDTHRVYVTGISNGGFMSYRLGCALADQIAAIGPVAGALLEPACAPSAPVSVLAFHGTADPLVPYDGATGPQGATLWPSVLHSVGFWARHDGCAFTPPTPTPLAGGVLDTIWPGCPAGTAVELITIPGGGHLWPGGVGSANDPAHAVDATALLWTFFAAHPRP
jgi:polyhydroxybutyrate depolymerase